VFAPQFSHAASAVEAPRLDSLQRPPQCLPVEAVAPTETTAAETPTVEYTVRRGDSLWKIAEEHLGDGMRFREIVALNQAVLPADLDFIDPGMVLRLPSNSESEIAETEETEEPPAEEAYVVEPGDTLWGIAEETLGEGERYPEVFQASRNTVQPDGQRLTDPDLIRPGWELAIPPFEDDSTVVEPPEPPEPPAVEDSPVVPGGRRLGSDPVEDTTAAETPEESAPTAGPSQSPVAEETDAADSEDAFGLLAASRPAGCGHAARRVGSGRRARAAAHPAALSPTGFHHRPATAGGPGGREDSRRRRRPGGRHDRPARPNPSPPGSDTDQPPQLAAVEVGKQTVTLHLAGSAELPEPWVGAGPRGRWTSTRPWARRTFSRPTRCW
jgi:LysM repeat protein